jgi:D-beta-D-heptose 7-phosphate kinase/D-beta-D-heptose 1-phosphate adenosyltransferase
MVRLSKTFSLIQPVDVLLIGDYMLDKYTTGKVKRISPEAPVCIIQVEKETSFPGGAGNVALNFLALGAKVFCVGRVGSDLEGRELKEHLQEKGANVEALFVEKETPTSVKNRLVSNHQQILRIDREKNSPISSSLEKKALRTIAALLTQVKVVAISDYGKGFLSDKVIQKTIKMAKDSNIPVIVDPKGIVFSKYQGATLIKPNQSEAFAAAKVPEDGSLEEVADILLKETQVDLLMITRSEAGISLFDQKRKRQDFPVKSRDVKDVTGAGDTVLSVVALALANKLEISHAIRLANIAAGIAVEHVGCVPISLSALARRLLEFDVENKIFESGHLYALTQVLKDKKFSLLNLEENSEMNSVLFRAIKELSKKEDSELIIYIPSAKEEFVSLLSSLSEVNFIILQRESLENLCSQLHPQEVYEIKGEQLLKQKPKVFLETLKA